MNKIIEFKLYESSKYWLIVEGRYTKPDMTGYPHTPPTRARFDIDSIKCQAEETVVKDKGEIFQLNHLLHLDELLDEMESVGVHTFKEFYDKMEMECLKRI